MGLIIALLLYVQSPTIGNNFNRKILIQSATFNAFFTLLMIILGNKRKKN